VKKRNRWPLFFIIDFDVQLTLVISNSMGPWKKFESTVRRIVFFYTLLNSKNTQFIVNKQYCTKENTSWWVKFNDNATAEKQTKQINIFIHTNIIIDVCRPKRRTYYESIICYCTHLTCVIIPSQFQILSLINLTDCEINMWYSLRKHTIYCK
jgi:hypothetical protein